jgi:hypothetical protein
MMMQRWMQAKMAIAAKNGTTKSGANRAIGGVWDDRKIGYRDETVPGTPRERLIERHGNAIVEVTPVLRKVKGVVVVLKADAPVAWGKGRKARRLANGTTKVLPLNMTPSSSIKI